MKPKKCKECGKQFTPFRPFQKCCDLTCAIELAKKEGVKTRKRKHSIEKRKFYEGDRSTQLRLAQKEFNAFIRERDKNVPCISCNRMHQGQYHAGHYRSVGAAPHLRFNTFNVHKQCAPCNNHKSGNAVEYRINLVQKIGVHKVEEIESTNDAKKWTLDEIIAIKNYYKKLRKRLTEKTSSV